MQRTSIKVFVVEPPVAVIHAIELATKVNWPDPAMGDSQP
jgi:hypothetical protein